MAEKSSAVKMCQKSAEESLAVKMCQKSAEKSLAVKMCQKLAEICWESFQKFKPESSELDHVGT